MGGGSLKWRLIHQATLGIRDSQAGCIKGLILDSNF